jgi:uncharacterized protein
VTVVLEVHVAEIAIGRVPEPLLRSIVRQFDPQRVILFGSHARGEARPDSDIDLLVIIDDDVPAAKLGWRSIQAAREDFHEPVDIIPWPRSDFEARRHVVGSLPWTAEREGLHVHERR